jgi:hypothetical protein
MPFQSKVNLVQAPGVEGDFASMNPFSSVLAGPGALVAPAGGLIVGHFAWVNPANNAVSQTYVSGYQIGFLGRNENALITQFLGEYTMVVPQGFMVNLFNGGDFWARFGSGVTSGGTVYADETTGAPVNTASTDSGTGSIGFTGTASFATNVMTVVADTSGGIYPGDVLTSAGVTAGTTIVAQLTGATPGAVGSTYSLSTTPGTITTQAATTTSTVLTISAVSAGEFGVGDPVTGSGISTGTKIASLGTGVGGVGTYNVLVNGIATGQNAASTTITGAANITTGFVARSTALAGEIAKISANVA